MPQRNSAKKEQACATLRRSPRFLHKNRTEPQDPQTSKLQSRSYRVSSSNPSPISSTRKAFSKKTRKHFTDEVSKEVNKSHIQSKISVKSSTGSRRSARLQVGVGGFRCLRRSPRFSGDENDGGCNERVDFGESEKLGFLDVGKAEAGFNSHEQVLSDYSTKRVTRSAHRRNSSKNVEQTDYKKCSGLIQCAPTLLLNEGVNSNGARAKVGVQFSKHFKGKLERKVARSSSRENAGGNAEKSGGGPCNGFVASTETLDNGVCKQFLDNSEKRTMHSPVASAAVIVDQAKEKERVIDKERKDTRVIDKERKNTGVKRKRNPVMKEHGIVQGWTKEQELALQRAYIAARPTPHFWKKVARLVPGKSAQDCFNRIHSDYSTPPQPQTRSRARKTKSSTVLLSAGKLLNFRDSMIKKLSYRKRKPNLTHKTLRELVRKQYEVDRDPEADLFSVLEPMVSPSVKVCQQGVTFSTPECGQTKPGYFRRCKETSSSAHKKHYSRFSNLHGATLVSPPVLKQVKNKALHEKYIDQLHFREAKRKAASSRTAKFGQGKKEDVKDRYVQKQDAIKSANNALVLDVIDAINQFQHLQANATSSCTEVDDDDGDGGIDSDEEDSED